MKSLLVWTVFDGPSDFPDDIVVRAHHVLKDGVVRPDEQVRLFRTLERAREFLLGMGLARVERHPEDPPVIVETWL